MLQRKKLILATHNPHKEKEMMSLLSQMELDISGLGQFPEVGEIEETGNTLHENALIKARTVYKITGNPSLADDTGLEVKALAGAPGVYSARYAGNNPSYEDNIKKLLEELVNTPKEERGAQFRTVMAFVDRDVELYSEGVIKGEITFIEKGNGGFGYDSVFQPYSKIVTFAELSEKEKNKISHRAIAAKKMKEILESYLKKETI